MTLVEEWRPIPGFPGYDASNLGRIRSWRVQGWANLRRAEPRLRRLQVRVDTRNGRVYTYTTVAIDRGRRKVAQLVAAAFLGPRPQGMGVLHWNDDATDNRLENLRYGTQAENVQDAFRNGGRKRREESAA